MTTTEDHVLNALREASTAPGAVPKLNELGITAPQAQQLITHISRIPAFQRAMDQQPKPDLIQVLRPMAESKLVFLHLPKCGGTTLHDMIVDWFNAGNFHPERHNNLYTYPAHNLASWQVFSGHFDYYSTMLVPGHKWRMTMLREPRARLVSLYNFHRSHREDVVQSNNLTLARWAQEHDINTYFSRPEVRRHVAINNSMVRFMSSCSQLGPMTANVGLCDTPVEVLRDQAIENLKSFAFIGIMENYAASVKALAHMLGQTPPETIGQARKFDTLSETDPSMKKIEKQEPDEDTHRLLDDLVREDEALYKVAVEINATYSQED